MQGKFWRWRRMGWVCLVVALALLVGFVAGYRESHQKLPMPPLPHRASITISVLDNYVGYYQWDDDDLITVVTREGDHLFEQYPFMDKQEIQLQDATHYLLPTAAAGGVRTRFGLDAYGRAQNLFITTSHDDTFTARRLDPEQGRAIFLAQTVKQQDQIQTPGSDVMLRRIIEGIILDQPEYQMFPDDLAKRLRADYPATHDQLSFLGAVHEIKFLGVGLDNEDIFRVTQDNDYTRWHIILSRNGVVKLLQYETEKPHSVPM